MERMKDAFAQSFKECSADGNTEEEVEDVGSDHELDQRREKEQELREILPSLQRAGGLVADLFGDTQLSCKLMHVNATLNG